jgi:CO/xanthine dehydrogenase Mo-binding subunit
MAAVTEKRVVGIPTPRVEGEQKVTGRAVYAADAVLPGMLWVKLLRSPARAAARTTA